MKVVEGGNKEGGLTEGEVGVHSHSIQGFRGMRMMAEVRRVYVGAV